MTWRLLFGKIACLATLIPALSLAGCFDHAQFLAADQRWPREGGAVFASHFATWDAAHYLYLSEVGYGKGVHSCAFYPLWPLLIRWFSVLTGGNHLIAGMVLANVFSGVAWVIFYQAVRERFERGVPGSTRPAVGRLSLVLLVLFPGSLFFQFIYSESLFLLLVMLLWWALDRQRYDLAWGAAFLLPLTRAVGLFCILPILWQVLSRYPPRWAQKWVARRPWLRTLGFGVEATEITAPGTPGTEPQEARGSRSCAAWLLLAPLLGWACHLALMRHWTGNPFEGFAAQKHWGVHAISNLWNVPKFIVGLLTPTRWHAFSGSLLDRCVFILLVYCLPLIWKLDKSRSLMVWTYVLGIMPAMSGTFTSYIRFASCAFPMFIALGVFLAPPQRRYLRRATLAVFATLHLVLVWRFVNFRWAG